MVSPIVGSEQGTARPVLVLAVFPDHQLATIVPITSGAEDIQSHPTVLPIPSNSLDSGNSLTGKVLVHQIRTVSYHRFDQRLGALVDRAFVSQIRNAVRKYLALP
jgi:mRNA-degrading endonuclease toxin of MazEF toxin-antitoxin module